MNEKDLKARYRNKLNKIIIEVWNGEKWLYVKTLSDPLTEFRAECLAKVSSNTGQIKEKDAEKFAYQLLTELDKKDTPIETTPELLQKAKEAQDRIMKKMLEGSTNTDNTKHV